MLSFSDDAVGNNNTPGIDVGISTGSCALVLLAISDLLREGSVGTDDEGISVELVFDEVSDDSVWLSRGILEGEDSECVLFFPSFI